jgi:hypothetical protein
VANVFEGAPDARQSDDTAELLTRFRPTYRALSAAELEQHNTLKAAYEIVERLVDALPAGRYRALALTALEESCMWAVKELTANR